ncbi:hypothetical protein GO730_29865 [Spirosoma sp. HMF3257]|uniref:MGT family glycosyltransferase n=1 Tax=Spirosoma telluris TaxID=2183553 RepID=A0A327NWR5_9BACT|nr:hypothetical protein [Spirosoma telluris]RAI77318.1 hypothetical protein HMF3257_29775 [Spirosoma telluris]
MTALFLMVPAYGHLNATFRLARQLQKDGYIIVYAYAGLPELAEHIRKQGFGIHWLQSQPFGLGVDEVLNRGVASRIWKHSLIDLRDEISVIVLMTYSGQY